MTKRLVAGTDAVTLNEDSVLQVEIGQIVNFLTASRGVYTNASKALTSIPPGAGPLGYWTRTGTIISPSAAGDIVQTNSGRIVNTTRIVVGDSPYTTVDADHVIFADTDGGAITVNLQAGTDGRYFRIINCGSSGNDVTIEGDGAETVRGAANQLVSDSEIMILTFETTEEWW